MNAYGAITRIYARDPKIGINCTSTPTTENSIAITIRTIYQIIDLLRNNLEKPGEGISVKRSDMHGAMDALEGCIL